MILLRLLVGVMAGCAFSGRPRRLEIKWIIIFCDIIYYCLCHEIKHHYDKLVIFVANFYIK